MNNHLKPPQETQLWRYSLKALYYKGFRLLKTGFLHLFTLFSPYFRSTNNILYNKKTQKPLCFLRFRALLFFSIKTDNPLIPSIFISLVYAVSFAITEKMDSRVRGNDRREIAMTEGSMRLPRRFSPPMTEGKVCKTCGKIPS